MLTRVAVENLKSFASRQEARLSKITLIYGPNSAGKSSIIQALLLLKQTMDKASDYRPAELVTRGPFIDVGSFLGVVHAHDIDNVLSLEVRHDRGVIRIPGEEESLRIETGMRVSFAWDPETRTAIHHATTIFSGNDELYFEMRNDLQHEAFWQSQSESPEPTLELKDHRLPQGLLYAVDHLVPVGQVVGVTKEKWASTQRDVEENHLATPSASEVIYESYASGDDFIREIEEFEERQREKFRQIESEYRDVFERFPWFSGGAGRRGYPKTEGWFAQEFNWHEVIHIGPVRHLPDRFEALSRSYSHDVGHQGEHTVQLLANDRELLEIVNYWLERLGIRYSLEALPIQSDYIGDIIAMSLRHRGSNVRHSFRDVGYGISQVIPIVAQCFAFLNAVLCIEQPELHIHPRLQAELGDLFIAATTFAMQSDSSYDFEDSRAMPDNQLIIETHSEHLLLRLQRRIREGVISNEDVSILYVDTTADGTSTIQTLRLDTDGSFLDEWPGGFFEERFNEIFGV